MTKQLKKMVVAAAVAGALGGVTGTASAFVYGLSHLNVDSLVINPQQATITGFTFSLANTATLTGFPPAVGAAACNNIFPTCGAGPVLDAPVASVPAGARPENFYGFLGPVNNYGSADSIIYTAQLTSGLPSSAEQIAEAALTSAIGQATGNAELRSNTSMTFGLAVNSNSLSLSFLADPDMRAAINEALPGTYIAGANLNASFTLRANDGSLSVSWSPEGTAANDCVVTGAQAPDVTCREIADTQDLNINVGAGSNPSTDDHSYDIADILTAFGIEIVGLDPGAYSLVLNSVTSVDITRVPGQVPEPRSLALVGLGLLAMGLGLRRRTNKS